MNWCTSCYGAHHVHHQCHGRTVFVLCDCCGDIITSFALPDDIKWWQKRGYVKWLDELHKECYY